MDSRLSYYNIPQSYKIFLTIAVKIAAQRIFMDKRDTDNFENIYKNLEMILWEMVTINKGILSYTIPTHEI